MLKIIMVMWLFIWIISDPKASSDVTIARLFLLVVFSAVWSVAAREKNRMDLSSLENQLKSLEGRVAMMEKSKMKG